VFGPNPFARWSGTSFAAPQVSGAIARLHQVDGFPLREALARLLASGRPVPGAGQAWKILPGI
jgi:subtilase family serine protease